MRALPLLLLAGSLGCTTGVPIGGRAHAFDGTFRRFNPPATARAIPSPAPRVESRVARRPLSAPPDAREKVLEVAQGLVGQTAIKVRGKLYPSDCTGLVTAAYAQLGVGLLGETRAGDNAVTGIYRFAQRHGRVFEKGTPAPGDLVFFRETYDQNRDGRTNDGLTHVGLVERVLDDGTVTVIHRVSRGVVRYRMNLAHPLARKDPASGRAINDYLRAPGSGEKGVLTGQLFSAYASLLPEPQGAAVARR